jgi:uncharacterized membrane protein YoaK (UPF0700 family)
MGGFVLSGTSRNNVLVRGIGPTWRMIEIDELPSSASLRARNAFRFPPVSLLLAHGLLVGTGHWRPSGGEELNLPPGSPSSASFSMLSKPTPLWVLVGGMLLAAGAGCINAVGFLGAEHQALTHLSGTVTNLGMEIARADYPLARHALLVILSFFLGSVVSGMIIRQSTLQAGRRYGVALMLESALLLSAAWLLRHAALSGNYLAAMACGLQNAMATSYSGAVIRTTHVTGLITDLGIAVGLAARRQRADWRRMRLYCLLLAGFFGGATLGTLGFLRFGFDTLLLPAVVTGVVGVVHTALKHYRRHHLRPVAPATEKVGSTS